MSLVSRALRIAGTTLLALGVSFVVGAAGAAPSVRAPGHANAAKPIQRQTPALWLSERWRASSAGGDVADRRGVGFRVARVPAGVTARRRAFAASYSATVLADSPVVYWRLGESSGTVARDATTHGLDSSYVGGVALGLPGALVGDADTSASLDGTSGYLTRGVVTTQTSNVTLEAWLYWTSTSGNPLIVYNGDSGANGYGLQISAGLGGSCGASNQIYVLEGGVTCNAAGAGGVIKTNQWTYIAATRTSGNVWTIYVNGVVTNSSSTSAAPLAPSSGGTSIGKEYNGSGGASWLRGRVDEVAIYNTALTAAQIQAHYNASGQTPGPSSPAAQTYGPCVSGGGLLAHALNASACASDPVNTATGAFTAAANDLELPGKGIAFRFARSYTSADPTVGRLGPGWTDNYAASLKTQANSDVLLHGDDGQQVYYTKQTDGSFVGAAGALSTLTQTGAQYTGGYKLLRHDQVTYQFDAQGRVMSELDRNGQGVTLAYDGSGRLATVTDAAGRVATFTSNSDGTLNRISLADGRSVSFGYTSGRLTSATDALSKTTSYSYDTGGRLASEVDPNNHTVYANVYDASGRVSQQTDALGKTTTFAWDSATQTATLTDARGNVWKDVYANNVLLRRIDPLGRITQFGHDTALDTTSVASPDGSTTSMTYDTSGNVLTATAPPSLGTVRKSFVYDAKNNVTSVTDGRGKVASYGYDTAGNTTSVVLDGTTIAQYTYNSAGQVVTSTDGRGKTTSYTYDANGNVASVTDPLGNKTTYTYDTAGRVLTRVDPLGNVSGGNPANYTTSYSYDADGRLLTETNPLGQRTSYAYDAAGNRTSVTDANGNTTSYNYDAANRLLSVTGPAPVSPVTSYTYDAVGNRLTQVDPRTNTTSNSYDTANRLASITTPLGEKTSYGYDTNGNLATVVDPRGNAVGANPADYTTSYTYDAAGRQLSVTDPLGNRTSYAYDAVGNRTSVTDANNRITSYTYDAAGRILTVTAPDGGVTTYTYDANGNQLTRTDANGHVTSYAYDDASQRTSMTGPGPAPAPVTTRTYDANANLASVTDPNRNADPTKGGITSYGYDRANRLLTVSYSDTTTPSVTYAYDAVGNRTSMSDGATQTYAYDSLNRLTSVTRGTDIFSYAYDAASNINSRTDPSGTVTAYTYDQDNRLATTTASGKATNYQYDLAGHVTQTTLPATNGYLETRSYDRAGRLIEVKNARGSSVLSDYAASLDPVGNPNTITQTGAVTGTSTYTYDTNDRLTGVCFQTSCPGASDPFIRWTYDKVGNRLTEARPTGTTNYTYNTADQLTAAGPTSYTYDKNGNQLTAAGVGFSYDLANRLTGAKGCVSGDSTFFTYRYDGDGNRIGATEDVCPLPAPPPPIRARDSRFDSHETRLQPKAFDFPRRDQLLWDVNQPLPQLAVERRNGALLRRYIYGRNRLAVITSDGGDHYYHYDTLGSVANLTSGTGTTEWTYAYEPFGTTRTETQNATSAPPNPMKFTGEYLDPTGLYNLRARQYDSSIGRFTARDPAQSSLSSTYVYVDDRPTVMIDPTGETSVSSREGQLAALAVTSPGARKPPRTGEHDFARFQFNYKRVPNKFEFKYSLTFTWYPGYQPVVVIGDVLFMPPKSPLSARTWLLEHPTSETVGGLLTWVYRYTFKPKREGLYTITLTAWLSVTGPQPQEGRLIDTYSQTFLRG